MKKIKAKRPRTSAVDVIRFATSCGVYYWPLPYDKKNRFIPSSVDCVFNAEYIEPRQIFSMLNAL